MEASTTSLKGQTLNGPRTHTRSAPTLPHAFNLREYSAYRGRVAPEPLKSSPNSHPLDKIDLAGGNGRWRQKRAKEQWLLDQAEQEKHRRQMEILEAEKRRRKEEREARRRKQEEEEQARIRAVEEMQLLERLEREERERREEERRLQQALEEQRDWLARQPKTCTVCSGNGKCQTCDGKGFFFSVFLSSAVGKETSMDFGRAQQGCPDCGGCAQNIVGELILGTGTCTNCDGVGMVTPNIGPKVKKTLTRGTTTRLTRIPSSSDKELHGRLSTLSDARRGSLESEPNSPTSPTSPAADKPKGPTAEAEGQ